MVQQSNCDITHIGVMLLTRSIDLEHKIQVFNKEQQKQNPEKKNEKIWKEMYVLFFAANCTLWG